MTYLYFSLSLSYLFFCFPRQIALADLMIINKTDLVNEAELDQLRDTIRYETTAAVYRMNDQIV